MYKLTQTFKPFAIDEDQDLWVAEISYSRKRGMDDPLMDHDAAIEVRAESEELLKSRVMTIVRALNED